MLNSINRKIKYWEEYLPNGIFQKLWIRIQLCNLHKRKQNIEKILTKLKQKNKSNVFGTE
jgi:hypothetical protein